MSVVEHLPTTARGRGLTLAGVAGVWALAYWVNGWLWDVVFYDVLDMAPTARLTETLGGRREGVGNVMAAGLGVVTPFCSCSAVPAFIGFVEPFVFETRLGGQIVDSTAGLTFVQRVQMGTEAAPSSARSGPNLWSASGWAVIHGWAPEGRAFTRYAGEGTTFGVLIAVAIGIPLSLPEMILLRRVLKPQLQEPRTRDQRHSTNSAWLPPWRRSRTTPPSSDTAS